MDVSVVVDHPVSNSPCELKYLGPRFRIRPMYCSDVRLILLIEKNKNQ